eukprot:5066323-Prymnesium_polylepis.1
MMNASELMIRNAHEFAHANSHDMYFSAKKDKKGNVKISHHYGFASMWMKDGRAVDPKYGAKVRRVFKKADVYPVRSECPEDELWTGDEAYGVV